MYRQLIISSVLITYISAGEQNLSKHGSNNNKALIGTEERTNMPPHNMTYIDKAENLIRLPAISKYYEENKNRKTLKKSPKRTIQKIIKKNRSKIKKLYIIKMTSYPTMIPKLEFENAQEEFSPRKEETTTQSSQKKRLRKYNAKLPRNPTPFHQMQIRKNNFKRNKRDTRDIFILKDFDSMQFLKQKKDYNVVNAHFQKYW